MSSTLAFVPKASNQVYTLGEINAYFAALAAVINAKLDLGSPVLTSNLNVGNVAIINLGDAVEDDDVITVGQARQMAGLA